MEKSRAQPDFREPEEPGCSLNTSMGVVFLTREGNAAQGKDQHLLPSTCKTGSKGTSWDFLVARADKSTEDLFGWKCHLLPPGDENVLQFTSG